MSFRTRIIEWLHLHTQAEPQDLDQWLEVPPQEELGDYAFPCFRLAKTLRQAPAAIAARLAAEAGELTFVDRVEVVSGYLNFFLNRSIYTARILAEIQAAGDRYGCSDEGRGQTILIDSSSPNIAKRFHVGHIVSTVIGHAMYRIFACLGYQVVRMNHLGDHGTQFGKLIVAYRRWGDAAAFAEKPIEELERVYRLFGQHVTAEPELEDEAREAFRRLEAGFAEEKELWRQFREHSLEEFEKTYQRMGIGFDNTNGESFYSDLVPRVVALLNERGLLEESAGAQVVRLDELDIPPCIILKSDGASSYESRDLAAILWRVEQYHYDQNLYFVDARQNLRFRQIFAVMRKAGFSERNLHLSFGAIKDEEGKIFASRSGNIIYLDDLIDESVSKSKAIILENMRARGQGSEDPAEINEIAEAIGVGAIFYTFLRNSRERDIIFNWEKMLDFDGDTAPYVQYSYARARSILRKAEEAGIGFGQADYSCLTGEEEFRLARLLEEFPMVICRAAEVYEPYLVTRYVTSLARQFNKYYAQESILGAESPLREARLALTDAVSRVIRLGLRLCGINTTERM